VIEAVGSDVDGFRPGERVTVPFHMACGRCRYCYSGRSNLCLAHGAIGFHFDGGFGRLARVPDAEVNLVRLPDEVDFLSAAALGCRYMTAYHGVVDRAEVRPGEWLAVFGVGGVGLSAVQIASTLGAQVVAIDINEEKLERARAEGAVAAINASEENAVEAIHAHGVFVLPLPLELVKLELRVVSRKMSMSRRGVAREARGSNHRRFSSTAADRCASAPTNAIASPANSSGKIGSCWPRWMKPMADSPDQPPKRSSSANMPSLATRSFSA
jgi:D-arabinose 1-dehydrogenase-like Zn-dependent alcohol dehydrogenase